MRPMPRRSREAGATHRWSADSARIWIALASGDYFALLAYIDAPRARSRAVERSAATVREGTTWRRCWDLGRASCISTGQAYKGGPNSGVFLQITCDDPADLPVPGESRQFRRGESGTGAR